MWWSIAPFLFSVAQAAPALTVTGACAGIVGTTLDISGATPGGTVVIASGDGPGTTLIPAGACAGTPVDLAGDVRLRATLVADGSGAAAIGNHLPAVVCGSSVQVVDLATCEVSNVVGLHLPITSLASADVKLIGEFDGAGRSVSGAGDVNGDGFDDLLVGAWLSDAGASSSGAAYLVLGPVYGELDVATADAKLLGEESVDWAGASVSGAGDVNGDGFDDLLVGAENNDAGGSVWFNSGAAYLVLGPVIGAVSLASADARLFGEAENDSAGFSVAGAGDVDGDGFDDILIGAEDNDAGGLQAGAAYLVYATSL